MRIHLTISSRSVSDPSLSVQAEALNAIGELAEYLTDKGFSTVVETGETAIEYTINPDSSPEKRKNDSSN